MAAEIEPVGVEGTDYIRIEKNERTIIVPLRKGDEPYHSDPQIRALQLVHEGRLGGPGRGQGRARKERAAQYVAEEVKKRAKKIVDAIDAGLDAENVNLKMKAADMALKIEREEALLQLREDEVDPDHQSKEELVATLIALVGDPSTEAALEAVIDIPPEAITEVFDDDAGETKEARSGDAEKGSATPPIPAPPRTDERTPRSNGRGSTSRNREKGPNPFTARAYGRAV